MSLLKAALGLVATAYVNDAVAKPRATGSLARTYCDRRGKPLLLIRGERIADVLMGDPVKADVVTRRAYPLPYREGTFGAVVVVNVLERLKRPDLAIHEWKRVADKVFVVTPSWWAPHAWLDLGHRWVLHPDLSRAMPLWTDRRSICLLPVSDRRYGAGACPNQRPHRRSPMAPSRAPFDPPHGPFSPPSESQTSDTSDPFSPFNPPPESQTSDMDGPFNPPPESQSDDEFLLPYDGSGSSSGQSLPDMDEVTDSDLQQSTLGSPPSPSSTSPKALTVVSTHESLDS